MIVEKFQHWTGRTPASYLLRTMGAPAVPWLVPLLDHDKERVRQQAALALAEIGLRATPARSALERLAKRTPQDKSTRAASSALGDVAPAGVRGWLMKAWYELPFVAVFLILVAPFLFGVFYPRRLANEEPASRALLAPGPGFPPSTGLRGWRALGSHSRTFFGELFTVDADVWALAAGVYCLGACGLWIWLRGREAAVRSPA